MDTVLVQMDDSGQSWWLRLDEQGEVIALSGRSFPSNAQAEVDALMVNLNFQFVEDLGLREPGSGIVREPTFITHI